MSNFILKMLYSVQSELFLNQKMKSILLVFCFSIGLYTQAQSKSSIMSLHDFSVQTIEGDILDLSSLKGKKVLVVNTASKCAYTPQYEKLQSLYDTYGGENFVVIGFPANDFLRQEPGSDSEIQSFCEKNYGVTFPMMSKISVKGKDMHEVYQFLTQKSKNGFSDNKVKWNFQKYLINENGLLEKVFPPGTSPMDKGIIDWIKA